MGLEYGFMRNAFAAVLIITPLFGMLGTMIGTLCTDRDCPWDCAGCVRYQPVHGWIRCDFCTASKLYRGKEQYSE